MTNWDLYGHVRASKDKTDKKGHTMSNSYKVGHKTQFGLLVAEAANYNKPSQIWSIYQHSDESGYKVIEWDMGDEPDEFSEIEVNRTYCEEWVEARRIFLKGAFGINSAI